MPESTLTALALALIGALLAACVLTTRAMGRTGIPVPLIFLVIGMLAGSEGLLGIPFEDYRLAYRLGTAALVLILFDGGLHTPWNVVSRYGRPAGLLATVGVVITAVLVACAARLIGMDWSLALLLGAIVSSTDAAAVFAVLRGSGLQLRRRPAGTLELESGLNDPMAVILTTVLVSTALAGGTDGGLLATGWTILWQTAVQLLVGTALGLGLGWAARWLLLRIGLTGSGLYPVLTLAVALVAYGLPTLAQGSGFLAVFLAGMVIGNARLPHQGGLLRVHEAMAWTSQVGMFLLLGLLVFPTRLLEVWWQGLVLALVLAVVARPVAVVSCLLPFRFPAHEMAFIAWTGLRGAVPIVLAILPVMQALPGSGTLFDMVFFVVVVGALIPGSTVPWVTRRLGIEAPAPAPPQAVLEVNSARPFRGELLSFFVHEVSEAAGIALRAIPFPDGSSALLIVRGEELVAARGTTVLAVGDHVYIYCRKDDVPFFHLLFGAPEHEAGEDAFSPPPPSASPGAPAVRRRWWRPRWPR